MAGASLAVAREQQGGVAGLVGSVQGIPAVIAPILSTSLYQVDKDLPFAVVAGVVLLMAITLLSTKNKSVGSQLASEPVDSTK